MARCLCGCGGETDRTWVHGHDSRALWNLIEMTHGFRTTEQFLAHHGYGPGGRNLHQAYQAYLKARQDESGLR